MSHSQMNGAQEHVKIILVTGGVMSGVGKGIISSSIGVLLKSYGYRVSAIKIDPYINVDAGTFSPFEHGEVFVLDDGGEVDLDLGNYERFIGLRLSRDNNITTGKIYLHVINKERGGHYLGKTVKLIPDVTEEIKNWINRVAKIPVDGTHETPHVCIVELGGTLGDLDLSGFTQAFSRVWRKQPLMILHVTKVLNNEGGENKTKPAQNGLKEMHTACLIPDLIIYRSQSQIREEESRKIAEASSLEGDKVIHVPDCENLYRVPLELDKKNVMQFIREQLQLPKIQTEEKTEEQIAKWRELCRCNDHDQNYPVVKIAFIAKYFKKDNNKTVFQDAYSSVIKALRHAAVFASRRAEIVFINAEHLEPTRNGNNVKAHNETWNNLKNCDGILVPGGFGVRGIEGKIAACQYARENKKPFLGICLGLQCAAIEFARNVCGIVGANSTEFNEHLTLGQQVVIDMPEHAAEKYGMGATMRLGKRTTMFLTKNCLTRKLYNDQSSIVERHRHRYEVNPSIVSTLTRAGLLFVGMGVDETNVDLTSNDHLEKSMEEMRTNSANSLVNMATDNLAESLGDLYDKIDKVCGRGGDGKSGTAVRMEIAEIDRKEHPYFVALQSHPEFLSSPTKPSPPFFGLILAASNQLDAHLEGTRISSLMEKLFPL